MSADAIGVVHTKWDPNLDYFGTLEQLPLPPGATFTIVVPEPAIAALLGLGMLGIAFGVCARRASRPRR